MTAKWNGSAAKGAAAAAARTGLEAAAAHVLAESQKIVPFIKGDLAASGASGLVGDRAAVTYTDRGAVDAHERMEITPANGRQRKYLEAAANSSRDQVGKILQREVRRGLDR